MTIVIVGLGLIGGSLAKALSARTAHTVIGLDIDSKTIALALDEGSICRKGSVRDLPQADLVIVALHPQKTIDFLQAHWSDFNPNGWVMDTCGVKTAIYEALGNRLQTGGPWFIGAHPMAGRELFGYEHALDTLFDGASLIVTEPQGFPSEEKNKLINLAESIGFDRVVFSNPETHDRIIAYTSQLAHVVSSAYIKSPTMQNEAGFSAGSFRDMTRVARLDEMMWSELFLLNQAPLVDEIDGLIEHLQMYRDVISAGERDRLMNLLKTGREQKEWSNQHSQKPIQSGDGR